jgi:two-component system, OmpR family, phosphate regulon sensor histidine kinase PhoR
VEKHRITLLLVAISAALIGLMGIQVKWMRDSMMLREAQFERSMDHALFNVSDKLEQLEKMHDLRRLKAGKKLLRKLDALRRAHDEQAALSGGGLALDPPLDTSPVPPDPPDVPAEPINSSTDVWSEEDLADREAMITEMVRSIYTDARPTDIKERIVVHVLDSLLRTELRTNGVQGAFTYGVFTEAGEAVELGQESRLEGTSNEGAVYRQRLYRHDLAGPVHYLHVGIPGHRGMLWRDMAPLLLTSALFMAIIVVAFFFTIRTIFRQKRIGEIRNDLVNNLTHELKTPISTIGLACEALADPSMPKTEQQVRTFVAMIRDENKRLGSLVENVLQSAVLESGHMVLKRVDLDVHALVQDVVRSSSMQVSRRNGRIDLDLKAEIHHVNGDRIHLTNLLYNLIDNAVKYTEQEPRIRIASVSNDEGITVSVTDNGIGIAPSEQRKIFDRLYRVPTGNIHNAKGFGLGLSYVRTVVERHGGRIRLESTPGSGSTFHIFIPFEHVSTAQAVGGRG